MHIERKNLIRHLNAALSDACFDRINAFNGEKCAVEGKILACILNISIELL
jgi:hypothetical protein